MQFGIILTAGNLDEMLDLAAEAEAAGWDGVALPGAPAIYDPWVAMAGIAMRTERVRIGAIVTPPTRRRPWKLARLVKSRSREVEKSRRRRPDGETARRPDGETARRRDGQTARRPDGENRRRPIADSPACNTPAQTCVYTIE